MTATATQLETAPADIDAEASPDGDGAGQTSAVTSLVEVDLLVEDVSIDGMCGVY